jgi:hypothetical protein
MFANNGFLMCALTYLFFRGNALLDRGVAKGKITADQAAKRKKYLRPMSGFGAVCLLVALVLEVVTRH